jgi:hypothetical protein
MKKDWSQAVWIAFIPVLAVAFLYLAEGATRNLFFMCKGGICRESDSIPANIWSVIQFNEKAAEPVSTPPEMDTLDPDQSKLAMLRFTGRIGWFTVVEIYLFVCLAALIVAAILTFQRFSRRPWLWTAGMLLVSTAIGLVLFAIPKMHMAVFLVFFEKAIKPDLGKIADVTNVLNSLGNAATFALLLTICAVLLPTPAEPYPAGLKQLSQKVKALRVILYVGTLLLVTTMLLKNSIFQWALAYTSQKEAALVTAKSLVASFMSMDGTFYTLMLAAAYLPASFILKRRARLLAGLPADEAEVEKKLEEYGLTLSYVKSIPRALAIFAPFLAGPLGELISNILFK